MTSRIPNQSSAITGDKMPSRLLARAKTKRSVLLPQFKERMLLPLLAKAAERATKDAVNPKS